MHDEPEDSLFDALERRALEQMDEEADAAPDLLNELTGEESAVEPSKDVTLGGYIEKHSRVPAFDGSDGQPYTVDIETTAADEGDGAVAFLIFIRWAATGAGIMDHLESGDVAAAATEEEARQAAMELSLYELKAELDAAIARRRAALED